MTILFDGVFKSQWNGINGPIDNWNYGCIVSGDRFTSLPVYDGHINVGKFIIKDGDECNSGTTGAERCMVGATGSYTKLPAVGNTVWFGFSFKLDSTWTLENTWQMLWQLGHPTETIYLGGLNELRIRQTMIGYDQAVVPEIIISKNVWYNILMKIKLSYGSDGIYDVYIQKPGDASYNLIHSTTGQTLETDPGSQMFSMGMYRGKEAIYTNTIYYSDYKIGTTRADVEICNISTCDFTITG